LEIDSKISAFIDEFNPNNYVENKKFIKELPKSCLPSAILYLYNNRDISTYENAKTYLSKCYHIIKLIVEIHQLYTFVEITNESFTFKRPSVQMLSFGINKKYPKLFSSDSREFLKCEVIDKHTISSVLSIENRENRKGKTAAFIVYDDGHSFPLYIKYNDDESVTLLLTDSVGFNNKEALKNIKALLFGTSDSNGQILIKQSLNLKNDRYFHTTLKRQNTYNVCTVFTAKDLAYFYQWHDSNPEINLLDLIRKDNPNNIIFNDLYDLKDRLPSIFFKTGQSGYFVKDNKSRFYMQPENKLYSSYTHSAKKTNTLETSINETALRWSVGGKNLLVAYRQIKYVADILRIWSEF